MFIGQFIEKYPNFALASASGLISIIILFLIFLLVLATFIWNTLIQILARFKLFSWLWTRYIFLRENQSIGTLGQLLGSFIILSLAFAAHHWLVYIFAIIIIATLVTNSGFITDIVALIWNNKEYWSTKRAINDQEQASKNVSQQIESLRKNWLDAEFRFFYERVYNLIFGSQLQILKILRDNPDGFPRETMVEFHKFSPLAESYNFDSYIGFLIRFSLVELELNLYKITQLGKDFLNYLDRNNYSFDKLY